MKKSVFTLLAIATMVVSMSSCSQNDGGSSNDLNLTQTTQAQPKEQKNVSFVVCATPEQLANIDMKFVVEVNGQEKTLDASQMTVTDDASKSDIAKSMNELNQAFEDVDGLSTMKVLAYDFGKFSSAKCHVKSVNWSVKAGRTVSDDVDVLSAFGFSVDNVFNGKIDCGIFKSVQGDDKSLSDFCNITNETTCGDLNF